MRKAVVGMGLAVGVVTVALGFSPGTSYAAGRECRFLYADGSTAWFYDGEYISDQNPTGEFDYYQCQDGSWTLVGSSD